MDPQPRHVTQTKPLCLAADPHHFKAEFTDPDLDTNPDLDTDPSFHFNADPDPTFLFYADPDPGTHQSDVNLLPLVYCSIVSIHALHCSILIR